MILNSLLGSVDQSNGSDPSPLALTTTVVSVVPDGAPCGDIIIALLNEKACADCLCTGFFVLFLGIVKLNTSLSPITFPSISVPRFSLSVFILFDRAKTVSPKVENTIKTARKNERNLLLIFILPPWGAWLPTS